MNLQKAALLVIDDSIVTKPLVISRKADASTVHERMASLADLKQR
ncbi:hypothetical protein [Alicyclobacillus sp. SO9]|nr:hypothetical protein [Alicyclobacillus sp. SO9]